MSESTDSDDEGLEFRAMGADPHFSVYDIEIAYDPDFHD